MRTITTKHAKVAAEKLRCELSEGKAHTNAEVYEGDILVARFGIRRGSGEQGHGHLPSELHLKRGECQKLCECHIDRDGYIKLLREKGQLPPLAPDTTEQR